MKNKIIIALLIVLLPLTLISSNFYKNLAVEGKELYLSGKYEEAIENFRIAEFGLTEKKEILLDMYFYYSLAHFKLSNGDEVMELTDKLKDLSGISRFEDMKVPEEIGGDLDSMFSIIDKSYKKEIREKSLEKPALKKAPPLVKSEEYLKVYNSVKDALKNDDLSIVKVGLKKLKKLGKSDIRTRHISGIVLFRENKYKKAISELLFVSRTGSEELVNESSYYLALANYFEKNYGQFLAFSQKVKDKSTNGKLSEINNKVKKIRENGITNVKENFFNRKSFIKFISGFEGDILLGSDIFEEVKKVIPLRAMDVYHMANSAIKHPNIYNTDFIKDLIDLLSEKEMEEYAIDIVKSSKFYKFDSIRSIEVLYKLGILYNKIGKKRKMKKTMLRVRRISPDYKKVNYYLTN